METSSESSEAARAPAVGSDAVGRVGRWDGLGYPGAVWSRDGRDDRRTAGEPGPCADVPSVSFFPSGCARSRTRYGGYRFWGCDDLRANRRTNAEPTGGGELGGTWLGNVWTGFERSAVDWVCGGISGNGTK